MVQRIEHIWEDGIEKKWCGKCKTFKVCRGKTESKFGKGQPPKDWDGLRPTCKDCLAQHNSEHKKERHEYNAHYWIKTKDKQSNKRKHWGENNKEYIKTKNKEWREKNGKEYDKKEWQKRKHNPIYIKYNREYSRFYCRKQRRENPQYKIKSNISRRIRETLQNAGGKKDRTMKYVGCTLYQLQCHLEKNFGEYMTWENQGIWHIDHRIPANAFDMTNPIERQACHNYRNLFPMWATENILKKENYNPKEKDEYMKMWKELYF